MTTRPGTLLPAALLAAAITTGACGGGEGGTGPVTPVNPKDTMALRTLAEALPRPIGVGTAVGALFGTNDATGTQYMATLAREFDVITPENDMKFSVVQPTRGSFDFTRADAMVAFAKAHGMRVRGHTLVWYQQLPAWVTGGSWSADSARAILDAHIATVVGHYAGKLAAWDVVNEAYDDAPTPQLRSSVWMQTIGRGYIEEAFRDAHAADPGVPLFYNDYNIEAGGAKADSVYNLLADLRARGVPVDGIGMQMHLAASTALPVAAMQQNFARFASLGLKIEITELDIRVPTPASAASLQTQAQNYRAIYQLCLQQPACDMVVTWGFTDRSSWIPSVFPGQGDALLFDASFAKKPAYTAVHDLLAGN